MRTLTVENPSLRATVSIGISVASHNSDPEPRRFNIPDFPICTDALTEQAC
jgi:hypothetical protein